MVTVLSESDVRDVLELDDLLEVVEEALCKQTAGEVERPDRPHYPVGAGLDGDEPHGTGLTMPAYVHGDRYFATKLVSVNEGNATRGLPTIHAQIALTDARTGVPEAYMAGTTITNARTGCIGGLAVRELAPEASTVGVLGAGAQARWQTRAIATVADLDEVRVYSPSDSREECATDLRERGIPGEAVTSPRDAVEGADVVVTATTSTEPVFPADALDPESLVVAIGAYTGEMQELEAPVLDDAERVFADVPEEVIDTGDLQASSLGLSDLVAFGDLFEDGYRRKQPDSTLVVKSVGSAVFDAAAAQAVYQEADGVGTEISLE